MCIHARLFKYNVLVFINAHTSSIRNTDNSRYVVAFKNKVIVCSVLSNENNDITDKR